MFAMIRKKNLSISTLYPIHQDNAPSPCKVSKGTEGRGDPCVWERTPVNQGPSHEQLRFRIPDKTTEILHPFTAGLLFV